MIPLKDLNLERVEKKRKEGVQKTLYTIMFCFMSRILFTWTLVQ